jgi:hypothetical protein
MLRRVAFVRTDVSKELSAYFVRVTRIGELGTTLAVTSNRRTQHAIMAFEKCAYVTSISWLDVFILSLICNILHCLPSVRGKTVGIKE